MFNKETYTDTILVVDDEKDVLQSVVAMLQSALPDAKLLTAIDGYAALEHIGNQPVDLIISDFRMPGMDGLELLERCRKSNPETARIIMTAYGDMDVAIESINSASVTSYFSKPFDPEEVIETVWKVLDQRREIVQKERAENEYQKEMAARERQSDGPV